MSATANTGFAANDPALAQLLEACERHQLSTWEREFISTVKERRRAPTDRQLAILNRIAEGPPDYAAVNAAALRRIEDLLARWLPDGKKLGREYTARNPRRDDRHLGSFRINLDTGNWCDFVPSGAGGGDPISLAAYLFDLPQPEAARRLAGTLGISGMEALHA